MMSPVPEKPGFFDSARIPVGICLLLNMTLFAVTWWHHPEYLKNEAPHLNPDAGFYISVGQNFLFRGEFSRSTEPPYTPDFGVTPTYPLFAGALEFVGSTAAIYFAQVILSLFTCYFIYRFAAFFFTKKTAWLAAMLFALDPLPVSYNFQPMSEMPYLFLMMWGLVILAPVLSRASGEMSETQGRRVFVRLISAGVILGIAILARPAGLYLPVILCVMLAWRFFSAKIGVRRTVSLTLLFFLCAYLPVISWIGRNYVTFGMPKLARTQTIMLVYYTGASAWQVHHGISREEAQELIQKTYDLPSHTACHNPEFYGLAPAEIEAKLRPHQWEILLAYPRELAISSLTGILKGTLAHNTAEIAYISDFSWQSPGITELLAGREKENRDSPGNPLSLNLFFLYAVGFNFFLLISAGVGGIRCLAHRPARFIFCLLAGILLYGVLTMAVAGTDCVARYRIPNLPVMYLFAAVCFVGFTVAPPALLHTPKASP